MFRREAGRRGCRARTSSRWRASHWSATRSSTGARRSRSTASSSRPTTRRSPRSRANGAPTSRSSGRRPCRRTSRPTSTRSPTRCTGSASTRGTGPTWSSSCARRRRCAGPSWWTSRSPGSRRTPRPTRCGRSRCRPRAPTRCGRPTRLGSSGRSRRTRPVTCSTTCRGSAFHPRTCRTASSTSSARPRSRRGPCPAVGSSRSSTEIPSWTSTTAKRCARPSGSGSLAASRRCPPRLLRWASCRDASRRRPPASSSGCHGSGGSGSGSTPRPWGCRIWSCSCTGGGDLTTPGGSRTASPPCAT